MRPNFPRSHSLQETRGSSLVWEGVEQDRAPELLADLVQNPQCEHERYIATHVIPDLHGADPTAGPAPMVQNVATIGT
jgi:hypothetical protein